jgi:hypothetical protein
MPIDSRFLLGIAGTLLASGAVAALYVWPALRKLPRHEALGILCLPHAFRFMGLSFLFPGVVSPSLPSAFAIPAAWGDFVAAVLALLAILALKRSWPFAVPLVWGLNLWGSADLLNAVYQGISLGVDPGHFGAAFYIPTLIVPSLLVIHGLIFVVLLRRHPVVVPESAEPRPVPVAEDARVAVTPSARARS